MPIKFVTATILLVITPSIVAADSSLPEMWDEPSHQLVFQRDNTRVLDVLIAPGATSEFHNHRFATVYIIIQDAGLLDQEFDKAWSEPSDSPYRESGAVISRLDYITTNYYHRVRNTDNRSFNLVSVVNLSNPSAVLAADHLDKNKQRVDDPWFAEYQIVVDRGGRSGSLRYENDVVLVQTGPGVSHVIENRVAHSHKTVAGAVSVHPAGRQFRIVNTGSEAVRFSLIEVRDGTTVIDH